MLIKHEIKTLNNYLAVDVKTYKNKEGKISSRRSVVPNPTTMVRAAVSCKARIDPPYSLSLWERRATSQEEFPWINWYDLLTPNPPHMIAVPVEVLQKIDFSKPDPELEEEIAENYTYKIGGKPLSVDAEDIELGDEDDQ